MKSQAIVRSILFVVGQLLALAAIAAAFSILGMSAKSGFTTAGKIAFFVFVGVACLLGFGSLVLFKGKDRSSVSWIPIVGFMIVGSGAMILAPVFASARAASTYAHCLSNAKQLVVGMQIYSADWNDRFPPAEKWHDLIKASVPSKGLDLKCPTADKPFSYAMNKAMSKVSLTDVEDPQSTVLLFEHWSDNPNQSGDKSSFQTPHGVIGSVGFADGAGGRKKSDDPKLRWKPGP